MHDAQHLTSNYISQDTFRNSSGSWDSCAVAAAGAQFDYNEFAIDPQGHQTNQYYAAHPNLVQNQQLPDFHQEAYDLNFQPEEIFQLDQPLKPPSVQAVSPKTFLDLGTQQIKDISDVQQANHTMNNFFYESADQTAYYQPGPYEPHWPAPSDCDAGHFKTKDFNRINNNMEFNVKYEHSSTYQRSDHCQQAKIHSNSNNNSFCFTNNTNCQNKQTTLQNGGGRNLNYANCRDIYNVAVGEDNSVLYGEKNFGNFAKPAYLP
jgi:hypothetical protein